MSLSSTRNSILAGKLFDHAVLDSTNTASIFILFFTIGIFMSSLLGSVFVIIGLYILLWGKNKEMQNHARRVAQEAEEIKEQEPPSQVITVSCDSRCP